MSNSIQKNISHKTERRNIHEIVSSVAEKQQIEFFLIITYEFDPEQFFNIIDFGNELPFMEKINAIQQIRPIVIFDAQNASADMPHAKWFESYTQNKNFSCHHSKAYCIVTQNNEIHLILGSANFTSQGLFQNREVLEYFKWDARHTKDINILHEWTDFLKLYGLYHSGSEQEKSQFNLFCSRLEACCGTSPSSRNNRSFLIHSGYTENGMKKLQAICRSLRFNPTSLYVVSPFFDTNPTDNICTRFAAAFSELKHIHVCTDENNYANIGPGHFNKISKQHFYIIPSAISQKEYNYLSGKNERSVNQNNLTRHLHAKILILSDGKTGLCYIGSANFTKNAWLGKNNELGIAKIIQNADTVWEKTILPNLYAHPADRASIQFSSFVQDKDETDKVHDSYPDFIDYIELKLKKHIQKNASASEWITDSDSMYFRIHINTEKLPNRKSIHDYKITWKNQQITFDKKGSCMQSHDVPSKIWRELLPSDSCVLCFEKDDSTYFIPFSYDKQLFCQQELIFPKESNEFLSSLVRTGKRTSSAGSETNGATDREKENYPAEEYKEFRKSNPIIEMQQYLKLFGEYESSVLSTLNKKNISKSAIYKELEKLTELGKIIADEYLRQNKFSKEETLFKLGEIYYFIKNQKQFSRDNSLSNLKKLIEQIEPAENAYKNFIFGTYHEDQL